MELGFDLMRQTRHRLGSAKIRQPYCQIGVAPTLTPAPHFQLVCLAAARSAVVALSLSCTFAPLSHLLPENQAMSAVSQSTKDLSAARAKTSFSVVRGGFYETDGMYVEGGMSGGPVLADLSGTLTVVGVNVSASVSPVVGGIRAITGASGRLVQSLSK